MKPSVWTNFFYELSPQEATKSIREAGFSYSSLGAEHMRQLVELESSPIEKLEEFKAFLEDIGLQIPDLHAPICYKDVPENEDVEKRLVDFADSRKELRDNEIKRLEKWLEYCKHIDIKIVVVHPGGIKGWANKSEYLRIKEENYKVFSRLAEKCEKEGVYLAVENMVKKEKGMFGAYPEELLELCEKVGSPYLKICLDTSHANTMRDEFDIPSFIKKAKDYIITTHISDNLGVNDDHLLPYSGTIDWENVVRAFHEINYNGLFNLEIPGENRCPLNIKRLKARYAYDLLVNMKV